VTPPQPPAPAWLDRWDLAAGGAVLAAALAVRIAYVHQVHAAGLSRYLRLDHLYYHQWAQRIAGGDWAGREVFEMSPLYAYVLAVLYRIFGEGPILPRLIQSALGSLVCALLVVAGRRAFGKVEGILAGSALAIYAPAVFYDGQVMKTSFELSFTALMTFAFFAAAPRGGAPDPRWVFAGGIFLGLTALLRENILVAAPLFLAWTLWPRAGAPLRPRLAAALALAAGTALPILPATARNVMVAREWVLITSLGGENFYTGNSPVASGRYTPPPFVRPDPQYEHEDFRREAARRAGRPLTRKEASRFWYQEGLRFIRENPGRYLRLLADKLEVFFNDFERPDNISFYNFRRFCTILAGPLLHFAWVAPAGLLGAALSVRGWRALLPFHITFAAFVASALIFFTQSRYRVAAVPVLALFGAHAAAVLVREARARRWRTPAWGIPALVLLTLFVTRDPGNTPLFEAQNHSLVAEMLLEAGRPAEAASEYRACIEGIERLPASETVPGRRVQAGARLGLARALLRLGDRDGAARELRLAAESPREDVRFASLTMLGILLAERGDGEGSLEALRRAAAERPSDFDARMLHAEALARAGRAREALAEVEAALRIRPSDPEALRAREALARGAGRSG
jgi:Flp pilus assembly protein TadD/4-amino-4-deoxy-L-arabinose transferase-like glycosyltransferase